MAEQPNHPHIMAEILAAELCPDAKALRQLQNPLFPLEVTECPPGGVAGSRQRIQVAGGSQLGYFNRVLGRRAADHTAR